MTKTILLGLFLLVGLTCNAEGQNTGVKREDNITNELSEQVEHLLIENQQLNVKVLQLQSKVEMLDAELVAIEAKEDSVDKVLFTRLASNAELVTSNYAQTTQKIQVVEATSQSHIRKIILWGILAGMGLLGIAILIFAILQRGIAKGSDAISEIRKSQLRIEEESVKLDSKLIHLLDKQLELESQASKSNAITPDHSLALKVADEIARMEKNLMRMDASVKGYKPLVKAIERLKDNFKAYGYDIVTYLGQRYSEGMRINADFVIDETLREGTWTITSVSKPQVHFNGELIQKASVTVSQNI